MAEEETSEDISIEDKDQAKILGLPKKLFFIAVAALVLIIGAAGAYFFLASGDKEPSPTSTNPEQPAQAAQQQGSLFFPSDSPAQTNQMPSQAPSSAPPPGQAAQQQGQAASSNQLMSQIFELREQVIQLKEENLILKKQIYDLETGNGPKKSASQPETTNPASADQPYKNPYNSEIKEFPPIEPYVPVDKPKPKFG